MLDEAEDKIINLENKAEKMLKPKSKKKKECKKLRRT